MSLLYLGRYGPRKPPNCGRGDAVGRLNRIVGHGLYEVWRSDMRRRKGFIDFQIPDAGRYGYQRSTDEDRRSSVGTSAVAGYRYDQTPCEMNKAKHIKLGLKGKSSPVTGASRGLVMLLRWPLGQAGAGVALTDV